MDKELMLFKSNEFGEIRVSKLNGEPIFAATDICKVLGYSNASKAINDHTEEYERYNESLERHLVGRCP